MYTTRIAISRAEDKKNRCCTHFALDRVSGPATFNDVFVQDVRANGVTVQTKMAKTPSDINVKIPEWAVRDIMDNKRKVDVRGPVFLTVRAEILE